MYDPIYENLSRELLDDFRVDKRIKFVTDERIDINKRPFRRIESDALQNFLRLKRFHVTRCNLEAIPSSLFMALAHLVEIDLSYNMLKFVDEQTFEALPKLAKLDLSHNSLKAIRANTFLYLHSLRHLDLSYNQIDSVERKAFRLLKNEKPMIIDLSSNNLIVDEKLVRNILQRLHVDSQVKLANNLAAEKEEDRAASTKEEQEEKDKCKERRIVEAAARRAQELKMPPACPFVLVGLVNGMTNTFPRKFEYWKPTEPESDHVSPDHVCSMHPCKTEARKKQMHVVLAEPGLQQI